jgi:aldehyde:ferredoxin oxidoreductase
MMNGYMGKILRINLNERRIATEELTSENARKFIGGSGLGAKMLYEETSGKTGPLAPDNILAYFTGPFGRSPIPSSNRHSIVARSPLTGIWGESDVGGKWGAWLKSLGYDGIVINGTAETPVYLYMAPDTIQIRDAEHLWGKDTYETEEFLEKELGARIAISCIGIAGENLVKFASIMHDGKHGRAAGRCGLGAVMGSKKLKAIVLTKGALRPNLDSAETLRSEIKPNILKIMKSRKDATRFGTARSITPAEALGDLPIKNWQLGRWSEGKEKIAGKRMAETILVGRYACYGCPMGCGRVVKLDTGPFAPVTGAGYEYETAALLGAMCLVDNMNAIAKGNELCNRYGLDTITTGAVVAFAMEAFERKILTESDTMGQRLLWGDSQALLKVIDWVARREGIGNILAEGVKRASEEFGHDSTEFAIHVKGLELPGHDPRCFNGLGLGYATSNRGACHTDSFAYVYEGRATDPSLGIYEASERLGSTGKGKLVASLQNYMALCDSLKICKFAAFSLQAADLHLWLNLITGWGMSFEEFLQIGERIFNLKRLFNIKCGVRRKDDTLPQRIVSLKREDVHAPERLPEIDKMLAEYYAVRGWDAKGVPRKEKLAQIGLMEI